ncbi:rhamnosyl transferase [Candidatus Saccharibacteria bacterium RIFCSPHIGHO2_01_FULL_46_30]|nr:MAG: rhamnosyl transferase [Candidatus Saccharibacteria bacterium RIFCSPHIGHO2_01_FULL_46_30]
MLADPYATVFIPTYFGEQFLDELLDRVFSQKVDFTYEVLVIDTSSTDRTPEIIKKYTDKHDNMRVKTITKAEYGHGKTRRDAAYEAKGEIVVYLSQDAVPAHDRWLYEMVKPFDLNSRIIGVTGKQDPRPNALPLLKNEIRAVFGNFGPDAGTTIFYKDDFVKDQGQYDFISFYSDVNSAARRSILTGEIPYKPVAYAEDQLFGRDIIDAGYMKAYASRGNVIHTNDIGLKDYKARMFDETLGLRRVGIPVNKPSLKLVVRMSVKGIVKDWVRTLQDQDYSTKRKLYWLVMNPFYHIEKWRGVRLAASVSLTDEERLKKYSLEEQQSKKQSQ